MRWIDTVRGAAFGCALALGCAAPVFSQQGTGSGASPAASSDTSAGQSRTGFGGLGSGLAMPALSDRGIEAPRFVPGVLTSATLTDNIDHRPPGDEDAALLFEVSPYLIARSEAPRAKYELAYQMRNFMRLGHDSDISVARHNMNGQGSFALASDNLWLDLSAFMGSINTNPQGALSADPSSSFTNRSNYRRFAIAPWYQDRLGSWAQYMLRYEFAHSDGGNSFALAKRDHSASASIDGIDRGARWNWGWNGNFRSNDFGNGITQDRRYSAGTLYYRVNDTLRLSGSIEYEQIDFVFNEDGEDHGWGPGIGVQWNPNSRLSFNASLSDRYYGTVGSAQASWSMARSTLGIQFSRSVQTNTGSSLLVVDPRTLTAGPSGVPNSMVNDLVSGGIIPPGGIPIAGSFVTDAAVLSRRMTAFWALRGLTRTLTLTAYLSDSENANQFTPSAASGPGGIRSSTSFEPLVFSGDLQERGLTLTFTQTLDARSRFEASIDRRNVESSTAGFENRLTTLRAGVAGNLTSAATAFLGARITRQSSDGNGTEYDENAVFGGVDWRF